MCVEKERERERKRESGLFDEMMDEFRFVMWGITFFSFVSNVSESTTVCVCVCV